MINKIDIAELFNNAFDFFLCSMRDDKRIILAFNVAFCIHFFCTLICIIIYYKNKHNSKLRFKMVSLGVLFLLCFCVIMINLIAKLQISIFATLIAFFGIKKVKKECLDEERKNQIKENIITEDEEIHNSIYTNKYFLLIVSIIISVLCNGWVYYFGI